VSRSAPEADIGQYSIEDLAGAGGMGKVYRARDKDTGERIALKIPAHERPSSSPPPPMAPEPDSVSSRTESSPERGDTPRKMTTINAERLSREARVLSQLRHPGIVRYVAHGVTAGGEPFLAMEWLEGHTLSRHLKRGSLSLLECVRLGQRVGEALGCVHAAGIVHRDVKPSNLFLVNGELEEVKLIDFGVARSQPEGIEAMAEGPKNGVRLLGTVGYTAPEQARGDANLDARTDVFSLGCVLYRALTGRMPFPGRDAISFLASVELDKVPTLASLRPDAPKSLSDLVSRMLAKERSERPADGLALAAELRVIEAELLAQWAGPPSASIRVAPASTDGMVLPPPPAVSGTRWLLGKPSPFVGRDGELSLLACIFDECVQESSARAVLLTGPVGIGRSRLRHEFLMHVKNRVDGPPTSMDQPTFEAARAPIHREWIARGSELGRGAPFALLAQLLRAAFDLTDDEPLELRRDKIAARAPGHVAPLLGELVGVPFPDDAPVGTDTLGRSAPTLSDVKRDAAMLGDRLRLAFETFLAAECAGGPVVIVLEDLDDGDAPSVAFLESALRALAGCPLFVLAVGSPDLAATFPQLGRARRLEEIRLRAISRAAGAEIVRASLGLEAAVAPILDRAQGVPLVLEEIIRRVARKEEIPPPSAVASAASVPSDTASSRRDEPVATPETRPVPPSGKSGAGDRLVEDGIKLRFAALDDDARLVAAAASILGQSFWRGAVRAVLEGELDGARIEHGLELLVRAEIVARRVGSRFFGEAEYAFRHPLLAMGAALLFDTLPAYAPNGEALPLESRARHGHARAHAWLSAHGEQCGKVLAEHARRGGLASLAAEALTRSAQLSLVGGDYAKVAESAELALACIRQPASSAGVAGTVLRAVAEAHRRRGELSIAARRGLAAARRSLPGSAAWFDAMAQMLEATAAMGDFAVVAARTAEVSRVAPAPDAESAQLVCLCRAVLQLAIGGRWEPADLFAERVRALAKNTSDPWTHAWVLGVEAAHAAHGGDWHKAFACDEAAVRAFEHAGDLRRACQKAVKLGHACLALGDLPRAAELAEWASDVARRLGMSAAHIEASKNLARALAGQGALDLALEEAQRAALASEIAADPELLSDARLLLARVAWEQGDMERAESESMEALALSTTPSAKSAALGELGYALLEQGRLEEALNAAVEAKTLLEQHGFETHEARIRLLYAEALRASGDHGAARHAIAGAREAVRARASSIVDPTRRSAFLTKVPDNARTLRLALKWVR
jgi:serine/threonine protein kinase/tetratricopeptide (TPR) repeat protein